MRTIICAKLSLTLNRRQITPLPTNSSPLITCETKLPYCLVFFSRGEHFAQVQCSDTWEVLLLFSATESRHELTDFTVQIWELLTFNLRENVNIYCATYTHCYATTQYVPSSEHTTKWAAFSVDRTTTILGKRRRCFPQGPTREAIRGVWRRLQWHNMSH